MPTLVTPDDQVITHPLNSSLSNVSDLQQLILKEFGFKPNHYSLIIPDKPQIRIGRLNIRDKLSNIGISEEDLIIIHPLRPNPLCVQFDSHSSNPKLSTVSHDPIYPILRSNVTKSDNFAFFVPLSPTQRKSNNSQGPWESHIPKAPTLEQINGATRSLQSPTPVDASSNHPPFPAGVFNSQQFVQWLAQGIDSSSLTDIYQHISNQWSDQASESIDESSIHVDPASLAQVMDMGYSEDVARRALIRTNGNVQFAVEFLLNTPQEVAENPLDQDTLGAATGQIARPELVAELVSMGFSSEAASAALLHTSNNIQLAINFLIENPPPNDGDDESDGTDPGE